MKHIALFMTLLFALCAAAQDRVRVTGTVINGADGNPLPFCFVHLVQDGRSMVYAVTDYAGNYTIPSTKTGSFDLLVVQFGDTLMHYKGLTLSRDTWVRSIVMPPLGECNDMLPQYVSGNVRMLRPVLIYSHRHSLLAKMGFLITDPNDPRLWDFSGQMDPFGDLELSFWWSKYKQFYKLKAMGYQITSPFELIYPEIYHPASDSSAVDYNIWILGFKF